VVLEKAWLQAILNLLRFLPVFMGLIFIIIICPCEKWSLGIAVKLLFCDHEIMSLISESSLFYKYRGILYI
jgi:hypothetical protein